MPLSTSTVCPPSLAVADLTFGLYVVVRLTVVFEPWSFGVSSISTTLLTPGVALGVVVVFSFRSVVEVTTPPPEFEDPPPVFSLQVCSVVVLSAVLPSSFFRTDTVLRLFGSTVCSTDLSAAPAWTSSTVVSVWTLVSFSQLLASLSGSVGGVVFSTVRFRKSVSVFSIVRVSPTSCWVAVFAATSPGVRLRSVVAMEVPRSFFSATTRACSTFLSLILRFVMSLVQSGFFVMCRSTRSPFPTLAGSPLPATAPCLTPRNCCSLTSSKIVFALS